MGKTWIDGAYIKQIAKLQECPEFLSVADPWSADVEYNRPREEHVDLLYVRVSSPRVWGGLEYSVTERGGKLGIRMRKNFTMDGFRVCVAPYGYSPSLTGIQASISPKGSDSAVAYLVDALRRHGCPAARILWLISEVRAHRYTARLDDSVMKELRSAAGKERLI